MSEAATEIVYFPLKPDINLEAGNDKAVLEDTLNTIARQEGLQSLYWGRQIEKQDTIQMVITWQNISNHTAFQESPAYQPFLEHLASILSGAPSLFHAKLPEGVTPFAAPVTECIRAHFAASQDEDTYLETGWSRFCHEANNIEGSEAQGSLIAVAPRCIRTYVAAGLVGGWSIERHEYKDEESKLFAAFIGWPSVEAHMAFRKTEDFGRVVQLLRGEARGIEVVHVEFVRHA